VSGVVADLFALAFRGPVPPLLDALVDWPAAEADRLAFKACPIVVLHGEGPPRGYVADVGDAGFDERVARVLGPGAIAFFAEAPGARRMVDTDGVTATLFLDDLHASAARLDPHGGHEVMCATWRWPDGERTTITRHGPPPRRLLAPRWQRHVDDVHHAGLGGIWAVRWRGDEVASLLWVNDTRWRGDPEATARAIDALDDPLWTSLRERAGAEGLALYPDSVEIGPAGAWEITVGLAPR
jgi:hypothetical protein